MMMRREESSIIIKKLAGVVKDWSPTLISTAHKSEVTIGGEIVQVLDSVNFASETHDINKCPVYLTLDDGLGTMRVIVSRDNEPTNIYETYKDKILPGNIILVTGLVEHFPGPGKSPELDMKHPEVRIWAYIIDTIPNKIPQDTGEAADS